MTKWFWNRRARVMGTALAEVRKALEGVIRALNLPPVPPANRIYRAVGNLDVRDHKAEEEAAVMGLAKHIVKAVNSRSPDITQLDEIKVRNNHKLEDELVTALEELAKMVNPLFEEGILWDLDAGRVVLEKVWSLIAKVKGSASDE